MVRKKRSRRKNNEKKPLPRGIRFILFLVGVLVLIVLAVYVLSLPIFSIKEVVVNGTQMLSPEEIKAMAGIPLSENLFFTKFTRAQSNLSKILAVKEFRFYRIPPGTVLINIQERKPVATILFVKSSAIIDEEGYIINHNQNISLSISNLAELPVISGVSEAQALKDNRVDARVAHLITEVILKLSRFMEPERIKLELGGFKNATLILDDLLRVKLGDAENIKRKIEIFVALLPQISGKWPQVEYADVRYPDNPVIKFR